MNIKIQLSPEHQKFVNAIETGYEWVTQDYVAQFGPKDTSDKDLFRIKLLLAQKGLLHDEYKLEYNPQTGEPSHWEYSQMGVEDVIQEYIN